MRFSCPNCSGPIAAHQTRQMRGTVQCAYCGSAVAVDRPAGAVEAPAARHAELPAPDNIEFSLAPERMTIVRRWRSPAAVILVVFVVVWLGFAVPMAMFPPFAILMIGVGLALAWVAVAQLLNRTTVHVTRDAVRVSHGPVPWPGGRTVPASGLQQVYCDQRAGRNQQMYYRVNALTSERGDVTLLTHLPEKNAALFIEQEIEKFLNIVNVPVKGEL